MLIKNGDLVEINYEGRVENGDIFDSSEVSGPLLFEAGEQRVLPGIGRAVIGMRTGEIKTVELSPDEGYGPYRPELIQKLDRTMLPATARPGDPLRARSESGQDVVVWLKEIGDDYVLVDANHPLAGKSLVFDIEVIAVNPREEK